MFDKAISIIVRYYIRVNLYKNVGKESLLVSQLMVGENQHVRFVMSQGVIVMSHNFEWKV